MTVWLESTIYRTRGKDVNNYTTVLDVVYITLLIQTHIQMFTNFIKTIHFIKTLLYMSLKSKGLDDAIFLT